MDDGLITAFEEEARVWAETFQARREILEEQLLQAEQAIAQAQDAVSRSRRLRLKIAARRARLQGRIDDPPERPSACRA